MKCPRTELTRRPHPTALLDLGFERGVIKEAMAQLSSRHRALIYRSHCLGRTTTQIAAELRTDDDLIKHELHHALHALRIALRNPTHRPIS